MRDIGFTLFDTALGRCGIAWAGGAVVATALPEADEGRVRERLSRRAPGAAEAPPPEPVAALVAGIAALLEGEAVDLPEVALAREGVPAFDLSVYDVARTIPRGATATYGDVAARIGAPQEARAVGQALARNPYPIVVPCHRVVAAGGRPGGFSADGGVGTKLRILAIEGAAAAAQGDLFRAR